MLRLRFDIGPEFETPVVCLLPFLSPLFALDARVDEQETCDDLSTSGVVACKDFDDAELIIFTGFSFLSREQWLLALFVARA